MACRQDSNAIARLGDGVDGVDGGDGGARIGGGDGVDGVFSPGERDRLAEPRAALAWQGAIGALALSLVALLLMGQLRARAVDARRGEP